MKILLLQIIQFKSCHYCQIVVKNIKKVGIVKLKNTSSYLNVRKESTTDSQVIGALDHNDRVKIIGETKGWYKIQYEDMVGYCSKTYIAIKKP